MEFFDRCGQKCVEVAYTCLKCISSIHIDQVPVFLFSTGRTMSSEIGQADEIFRIIHYLGPCDSPKQDVDLEHCRA